MRSDTNKGAILILSGPSGCGKSSLLRELYKQIDNYYFSKLQLENHEMVKKMELNTILSQKNYLKKRLKKVIF